MKNGRIKKPARDPDIDLLIRATSSRSNADIYHGTYLSRGTISRLRAKRTNRPSHMTMTGIAAACGMRWRLVKDGGS